MLHTRNALSRARKALYSYVPKSDKKTANPKGLYHFLDYGSATIVQCPPYLLIAGLVGTIQAPYPSAYISVLRIPKKASGGTKLAPISSLSVFLPTYDVPFPQNSKQHKPM